MSNEAPPKPKRGSWHDQAREMRATLGLSYDEIGYRLGVSGVAVYFCCNPHRRWKGKKKTPDEQQPSPDQSGNE
jgi:hypothetical protein